MPEFDLLMRQELAAQLCKPIVIGGKTVPNRLALAPLAGLGHIALREVIAFFGAPGLLFTGMFSSKAVPTENPLKSPIFSWRKEELSHLVGQIFGNVPEDMAAAAKRLEEEGFWGVDINLGCSVTAITKRGCGAALLRNTSLALEIVAAVRETVKMPLLAKMRTGWSNNPDAVIHLAQEFQKTGVDAITFHPRVSPDRRTRPPNLDHLAEFSAALSIPVFGNGNVFSAQSALHMLNFTKCAGLSLGRVAVARPWIFESMLSGQPEFFNCSERLAMSFRLCVAKIWEYHSSTVAIKLFRKFLPYFCANFSYGSTIYGRLIKGEQLVDIEEIFNGIIAEHPEVSVNPSLFMFTG